MTTFLIAAALLVLCAIALSIGLIFTGKSKLKKGCGPHCCKKRDRCDD